MGNTQQASWSHDSRHAEKLFLLLKSLILQHTVRTILKTHLSYEVTVNKKRRYSSMNISLRC